MKPNLTAFDPGVKQSCKAIMQIMIANGITDLSAATRFLESDIETQVLALSKESRPRRKLTPEQEQIIRQRRKEITEQRKERANQIRTAPPCPSCGSGKLIPSCGGALHCSHNCGYSTMRAK